MSIAPCQGGWCKSREKCQHYYAPTLGARIPADRLCPPGTEKPVYLKDDHDGEAESLIPFACDSSDCGSEVGTASPAASPGVGA